MNSPTEKYLLIIDGNCRFCQSSAAFAKRKDHKNTIRIIAQESSEAKSLFNKIKIDPAQLNSVIYIKNDRHYLHSSAVLEVFKDLSFPWKLIYIFTVVPKPIRDYFYKLAARNRHRFVSCKMDE